MNRLATWFPCLTMLAVSLISYIDRNTLALLSPTILHETGLNAQQYGYIIAAFSIAYTVANPLWGRWLDRVGVRWGMTLSVSVWTIASAAHSLATGLVSFGAARALLGFGEGATFPGGLRVAVQTLPAGKRSRGIAVAYSGGSLGAIVTPLIVTPIALRWGWRAAFLFTGMIGALWLLLWQIVSRKPKLRQRPEVHGEGTPPLGPLFRDARIWSFMCAYAWGALPLALVIYCAAIFLHNARGISQAVIGSVLWIPPLGWEAGYFFWGWAADRQMDAGHKPRQAFGRLLAVASVVSLPLAAAPWVSPLWLIMGLMILSMFAASGFIILPVGWAARELPSGYSGLIAGLGAGSWSLMVAAVMPLFGHLFDLRRFDAGFAIAALFPLAGFIGWWVINRTSKEEAR